MLVTNVNRSAPDLCHCPCFVQGHKGRRKISMCCNSTSYCEAGAIVNTTMARETPIMARLAVSVSSSTVNGANVGVGIGDGVGDGNGDDPGTGVGDGTAAGDSVGDAVGAAVGPC